MGTPTVSQKIDAYAKAHLAELKKKQGLKNFTKYDIAEIMLKSGALTQAEMNSWRSTREGFSANNRSGSVFGSGYAGQESYLNEMTDFSQKSTFEKNLEIMNPTKLRYETPKQRKTRQAQYKQHVQDQQTSARIKNTKAYQNQEAMKKYLATLPPCTESFEELMASQKFESLDKSGKIKFLMEATGRKFYEAMEKGDKSAMRKYALEGMSYVFAYMDDKSGITDIKDAVKKYSGLNALVDVVDKIVDDGDADNLSGAEKTWATIKGAGDAVDGFIGTQGIAVMGSLYVAGEAAAAAGMAKLFAVATQAYFGIEGATLVYEGGKEIAEATTEEQARTGGTKLTSGAIMLAGTVKSVKQGYENYMAEKTTKMPTDTNVVPDFATELTNYKDANGKAFLTKSEAQELLNNCQKGFITDGKPIPNYEAKIKAVLSNPEEIASISGWKNRAAGVWRAIQDPLSSTEQANPELFGVKPKATATAQKTGGATTTPDFATELTNYKDANGKQFLTKSEAESLMKECKNIPNYKAKLKAVLSNPEEIAIISRWKSRAAGVWRAIQDPLSSTEQANPELFGVKPKATATAQKTGGATVAPKTKTQNILETDSPVKFDTSNFETWAKENNLTMSIEEHWGESKRAIFKDSEGNVVRIINEDAYNPGQVYDDRVRYFKDGKQVAGKVKYTDTEKPAYYKVSSDGDVERMPLDKLNKELGL